MSALPMSITGILHLSLLLSKQEEKKLLQKDMAKMAMLQHGQDARATCPYHTHSFPIAGLIQ